jgi:SSS family solute:Na+ symporter
MSTLGLILAQATTQAAPLAAAAAKAAGVVTDAANKATEVTINLGRVDYVILIIYFVFVLGIGAILTRFTKTSGDFFLSGRAIPAWICGLAFISANLGAQEVIGMGASGAKYGIMTSHFYWVGAIPAMAFIAIFMMPFYYGSKARSVPEYLKMRFDEKTRAFNALTFAGMTVLSSGISMYALASLLELLLKWNFNFSLWISAAIVLIYITLGGLTSAIYNEVLQFFLIVLGFIPLVFLGLKDLGGERGFFGGWDGMVTQLDVVAKSHGLAAGTYTSSSSHMMHAADNPLGVEWFGVVFGLGFVLSFGYWCTDFLVVQRAMAANSMSAARRTPLIAAIPKMLFPFLVIVPGMIAMALTQKNGSFLPIKNGGLNYDMATPMMLSHYLPTGLLGLGLTALMASFMSGMAGNVTAFNTVFTYDIYQSYIAKGKSDAHYLWVGRLTTVVGIIVSLMAAYICLAFNNIMDVLQLVFSIVNAPLFATFMLGMFWKRATGHGAFWGLLSGTFAAAAHHGLTLPKSDGAWNWLHGGWLVGGHAVYTYPTDMAQNFWGAIFAFLVCLSVTVFISLITPKLKTDEELKGLVYSLTPKIKDKDIPWYKQPAILGGIVLAATLVLNIIFR